MVVVAMTIATGAAIWKLIIQKTPIGVNSTLSSEAIQVTELADDDGLDLHAAKDSASEPSRPIPLDGRAWGERMALP